MYYELLNMKLPLDMNVYSLKDLALYYKSFDGYICRIKTNKKTISFKFTVDNFCHLIGMQYLFKNMKNSKEFKGRRGFEKVVNGKITYEKMKTLASKNTTLKVSWKNIDSRIKFLPMFLNSITSKTKLGTLIGVYDPERATYMNGSYFLYRKLHNGIFPMLSLKDIGNNRIIIETFIVDNDDSIIKKLSPLRIQNISLIEPIKIGKPQFETEKTAV